MHKTRTLLMDEALMVTHEYYLYKRRQQQVAISINCIHETFIVIKQQRKISPPTSSSAKLIAINNVATTTKQINAEVFIFNAEVFIFGNYSFSLTAGFIFTEIYADELKKRNTWIATKIYDSQKNEIRSVECMLKCDNL